MKRRNTFHLLPLLALCLLCSCRGDEEETIRSTWTKVQDAASPSFIKGFYLLNEGNMGSNKSTVDYMDYTTGYYRKNIYAEINPSVVMELGDVGNDLQIYGKKLYAVINVSGLIEVMDVATAKHIGIIKTPNCRYISFHNGKGYISSYAGPVELDPNARKGYVAEIDTASLQVTREVTVGYQPEEMVVLNNKLYVANSGGYRVPNYDRTVSVIDLNTFTVTKTIDVAINLHRMVADRYGDIYVSSRGDYNGTKAETYIIDSRTDEVRGKLNLAVTEWCLEGDNLYTFGSEYNSTSGQYTMNYAITDVRTEKVVSHNFITDGTEKNIMKPYGLAVNPETQEIFVTDARTYVIPGTLYCFSPEGKKRWAVTTGDIPAQFAFVYK